MTLMSKGDGWPRRIALSRCLVLLAVPLAGQLAGCSASDQADTSNTSTKTTAPIQMPPAIVASHTYRCTGGEVLYVDFLQDGTSLNVKRSISGPSLRLTAPAQGLAYVGDGMNLTLNGKDIKIDEPKKPSRLCKRS